MIHPKANELFEFIDNRLDKVRAEEVMKHLEGCPLCRRKVELERSTRIVVHDEPLVNVRRGFSASVMVRLVTPTRDPLALRILGKVGGFVAMLVVLAVIGFAIFKASGVTEKPDTTPSAVPQVVAPLSTLYENGIEAIDHQTLTIAQTIENAGDARFWRTVMITVLTIGILSAADKLFGKRFVRLKQ